jgi:hypothetical protein
LLFSRWALKYHVPTKFRGFGQQEAFSQGTTKLSQLIFGVAPKFFSVGCRVVLGEVVRKIDVAGTPVYDKLPLPDSITNPMQTSVNGF